MTIKQILSILKTGGYILHKIGYALYDVDGYYQSHITVTQFQNLYLNYGNQLQSLLSGGKYTWSSDES